MFKAVHSSRVSPELCRRSLEASRDTVLLDRVCFFISRQTDDEQITSLCGAQTSHWVITINGKINVWKCKVIFPTDTLQQKIQITDLKLLLAAENTCVLIILATTVYVFFNLI